MELPRRLVCWGMILVAVGTTLAACSGPPPATGPNPAVISITDFVFKVPDSVAPGQTIVVVNSDADAHSVTSDPSGVFDVTVNGKSQSSFTAPEKAGDYPFLCKFHRYMQARLKVR